MRPGATGIVRISRQGLGVLMIFHFVRGNETLPRMKLQPLILINAVGLTRRLLAFAPRLKRLAEAGWVRSLDEVIPAVTCSAQVSILTGKLPQEHGIVGNGWLFRDTREVRFWQQSNALIEAETIDQALARITADRGRPGRVAKLFWWFNQGSAAEISVTPKPHYGADGNKVFGIAGTPDGLCERLEQSLGKFPFHTFWGPKAGLPCTEWIARCAAEVLKSHHPDLTLVYLPHLDYDPQRFGPSGCDMARLTRELDAACGVILDAAAAEGARVWIVSEYGHADVTQPILLNRGCAKRGCSRFDRDRSVKCSTRSAARRLPSAITRLPISTWITRTIGSWAGERVDFESAGSCAGLLRE